jgi:hypothetical protein
MKAKTDPQIAARKILEEKFPGAKVVFLAGSMIRGEGTQYSDLDLVVLFESVDHAWRESFMFDEWPVEAFVHDPKTLKYFFEEILGKSGCPSLPQMVLEGIVIPEPNSFSDSLKKMADDVIRSGPPPISQQDIDKMRYAISDLIDDLREPRSKTEAIATASRLYPVLADFFLRTKGLWSANGKTIPRVLAKNDPNFEKMFSSSFESLFSEGSTTKVISLTGEVLKPFGGFLFSGYRLDAPNSWKRNL